MHKITFIAIITISILVVVGSILAILWSTGNLTKSDESVQLRELEDPSTPVDKNDIVVTTDETSDDLITDTLNKWLDTGKNVDSKNNGDITSEIYTPTVVKLDEDWNVARSTLPHPPGYTSFGYSLDANSGVACIAAPDSNSVFIYDGDLKLIQKIEGPDGSKRFGLTTKLSEFNKYLIIQSESNLYIYKRDQGIYSIDQELENIGDDYRVLSASPEGCMWIGSIITNNLHILERSSRWSEVTVVDGLDVMDLSYDYKTRHMWVATTNGIQHWGKDSSSGIWNKNALWLPGTTVTSIEQFTPSTGPHSGINFLMIGEAHKDTVTLVTALNPNQPIDKMSISTGTNILYGSSILWWDDAKQMIITSPLDTLNNMVNSGSVVSYKMSKDSKFIPVCMLKSEVAKSSNQYGSNVKLLSSGIVLISSSYNGEVTILKTV